MIRLVVFLAMLALPAASSLAQDKVTLRIGHFPNITHMQALVAHALSRQGKGWFEQRLGPDVEVQWYTYNAGPSAMEALAAGSIDLTYVGPSPVINLYARSSGSAVRIISGAADGGTALVVQPDENLATQADFRGKKIATPQLGNTQDIACRAWLAAGGLKITQLGGDAQVIPTENPDQLALFKLKKIDAAWTVEPWVSRLEMEAGGKALVEQRDVAITVVAISPDYMERHMQLIRDFLTAEHDLTAWIQQNPEQARTLVQSELAAETKGKVSAALVAHAWNRIVLTDDISLDELQKFVEDAKAAGFMKEAPDLSQLLVTP